MALQWTYILIMGKMMGINGIWWSFLISETATVVFAIIYLGIAEKKELSFLASMPLEQFWAVW